MKKKVISIIMIVSLTFAWAKKAKIVKENAGEPFGELKLIDEVICAEDTLHDFTESTEGISEVRKILDKKCRVLDNKYTNGQFFAYKLGKKKRLMGGWTYVLSIEYPEDKPRRMLIINRGGEVQETLHTGKSIGDDLYNYTQNNCDSQDVPLSGKYEKHQTLFFLNDHFAGIKMPLDGIDNFNERPYSPKDGFWVIIGQNRKDRAPLAAGLAVYRIALYEVNNIEKLYPLINYPPEELPKRFIFTREEMSDSINFMGWKKNKTASMDNEMALYTNKAMMMRFLGMNTFGQDLLEFGHNQGFPTPPNWFVPNADPKRWEKIVNTAAAHGLYVLPYYEYAGGTASLGKEKRAKTLNGNEFYTHIKWVEGNNTDVTDPDTISEIKRMFDVTIGEHKNKATFVGAWIRNRMAQMPISFADATLERYKEDTGTAVTRDMLSRDSTALTAYYKWWFEKRRDVMEDLGKYLKSITGQEEPVMLYTPWNSEPGPAVSLNHKVQLAVSDKDAWGKMLEDDGHDMNRYDIWDYQEFIDKDIYITAITNIPTTWGGHEMHHADTRCDPENYNSSENSILTYPVHRGYSVAKESYFDLFRSKAGLAVIRQFPLNEWSIGREVGYNAFNVNRTGPYIMMLEALSMAYGNPRYLGYLSSTTYIRSFSQYMRRFNQEFLSLPAMDGEILKGHASDKEVIVREIKTGKYGTYYAIVNVSLEARDKVTVKLPAQGEIILCGQGRSTGKSLPAGGGQLTFSFHPCELKAVLVK